MPTLADIYSAIDSAKRKGSDLIRNPGASLQQMAGYGMDRANAARNQLYQATEEEGIGYGPKTQALAKQMAEGYNPIGMTKVYRGLSQPNNVNQVNRVDWFTPDKNLASTYGKHIVEKDLPEKMSPFDFGFRTYSTEIKLDNMVDRIKDGILDSYKNGTITEAKAKNLFKKASAIKNSNEYKPAAQWITDDDRLTNLLKESGYDTISHVQDGIQTYGFINK